MSTTTFAFQPHKNKDEEFCSPSNAERAYAAEEALVRFAGITDDRSGDTPALVMDLLTNIGHYCDREGLDFEDMVYRAMNSHWREER